MASSGPGSGSGGGGDDNKKKKGERLKVLLKDIIQQQKAHGKLLDRFARMVADDVARQEPDDDKDDEEEEEDGLSSVGSGRAPNPMPSSDAAAARYARAVSQTRRDFWRREDRARARARVDAVVAVRRDVDAAVSAAEQMVAQVKSGEAFRRRTRSVSEMLAEDGKHDPPPRTPPQPTRRIRPPSLRIERLAAAVARRRQQFPLRRVMRRRRRRRRLEDDDEEEEEEEEEKKAAKRSRPQPTASVRSSTAPQTRPSTREQSDPVFRRRRLRRIANDKKRFAFLRRVGVQLAGRATISDLEMRTFFPVYINDVEPYLEPDTDEDVAYTPPAPEVDTDVGADRIGGTTSFADAVRARLASQEPTQGHDPFAAVFPSDPTIIPLPLTLTGRHPQIVGGHLLGHRPGERRSLEMTRTLGRDIPLAADFPDTTFGLDDDAPGRAITDADRRAAATRDENTMFFYPFVMAPPSKERGEEEEEEEEAAAACSICAEVFKDGEQMARLMCLHTFHKDCILEWTVRVPKCPLCRASVATGRMDVGGPLVAE